MKISKANVAVDSSEELTIPVKEAERSGNNFQKTYRTDSLVKSEPMLVATSAQFGLMLESTRHRSSFRSVS